MNKKAILCLIAGGLVSFSCVRELEGAPELTPDNAIEGFSVQTIDNSTKSAAANGEETLFENMTFITPSKDTLNLSAYIKDMEPVSFEETKGAPIYTTNLGTYGEYNKFALSAFTDGGKDSYKSKNINEMYQIPVTYNSGKWSFSGETTYYWPDKTFLNILCIAPAIVTTDGHMWERAYNYSNNEFSWAFKYKCGDTSKNGDDAEKQYDLLLSYDKQNIESHNRSIHVNFKHALLGIQFEVGTNCNELIDSIAIIKFSKQCLITMKESGITYSNYSNASGERYLQKFNFNTSGKNAGTSVDSDQNKSKTFMFLPQNAVSNGAAIQFYSNGDSYPMTVSFADLANTAGGSTLADLSGCAGKIIIFRINNIDKYVGVTVTDEVSGSKKQNITIKNTGNCPVYIRQTLVGNWLSSSYNILYSWAETNPYGKFDDKTSSTFPGTIPSNWKKGSDGFYYYSNILLPGHTVSQNLFSTFERTSFPDKAGIKYLEMNIVVQAVAAIGSDKKANATKAWSLGSETNGIKSFLTTTTE